MVVPTRYQVFDILSHTNNLIPFEMIEEYEFRYRMRYGMRHLGS